MSRAKNETRQLISQESWLCMEIIHLLETNPSKSVNLKVKSNFINSHTSSKPVFRIIKFLKKTDTNDLALVLADSTHKIFARFPFKPTIVNFENKYNQRITYCTTNSLILVKQAELIRVSPWEIRQNYDDLVNSSLDYLVLNVLLLEIFQRDQILLTTDIYLEYIYQDDRYQQLCKHITDDVRTTASIRRIKSDYDDVVSL